MNFRTPYLVGLIASVLLVLITSSVEQTVFAAESLKITGPDGEVRQTTRQYGPTRASDTFWSIAQRMQPDANVSIYQVMGAIYDANPHAFSSPNYNSLEKGMILLIPSKELMLAIPKSLAKQRAERNDAGWKKLTAKPVVAAKPSVSKVDTTNIVESAASSTSASIPAIPAKNAKASEVDNSKMLAELEVAQDKNLQLTDELGRAQDELSVSSNDIDLLTEKVDGLNEEIAILQEQLQASRLKSESLSTDVEALKERLAQMDLPTIQEEGIKWKELMSNPLTLILGTAIPVFIFLISLWLFLKRRRNEGDLNEGEAETSTVQEAPESAAGSEKIETDVEEDLDNMAVHLDTEEDEGSLDSLMNVDASELQPEVEMEVDSEQMDMASEMFVDPGEEEAPEEAVIDAEAEDEGQSLDELWAEAMGEQDGDEEDLDSLLDGIGEDNLGEETVTELDVDVTDKAEEQGNETDLDGLLEGADESEADSASDSSGNDLSEDIAAELAADATDKGEEQVDEADLDALLAGFDEPTDDSETASAVGSEADSASDSSGNDLGEEIAAELAADVTDKGEEQVDEADLDALLAEFDEPIDDSESGSEAASAVDSDDGSANDSSGNDLGEEIAAELAADATDKGEEQVDEADLDVLLAGFDEPTDDSSGNDLGEEIAAELAADATDKGEEQVDEADLDALLAGFDEPTDDSEDDSTSDSSDNDLGEEIAAELEIETSDLEAAPSDKPEEQVDEALDALLADLESAEQASNAKPEPIKEDSFFGDLKGNKDNSHDDVEWDGELASSIADIESLSPESIDEDKITVDEALAALDAQESVEATSNGVDEHDLTNFQKDNGFIDIDRLLNEADEDIVEVDQYKELDVDMGELDNLMGNASMVDVDDEENSVNAKLDLARAYIEIDDNDSAIALLQEVKLDGNDNQKQEAEGLISSLT